jgi:hypothetical protein
MLLSILSGFVYNIMNSAPSYYPFLSKPTRNTTTSHSRYRPAQAQTYTLSCLIIPVTSISLRLQISGIGSRYCRSLRLIKSLSRSPCPVYSHSVRNRDGRLQPSGLARPRHHRPIVDLENLAPRPRLVASNVAHFLLDTYHHGEPPTAHHGYGPATYNRIRLRALF